MDKWLEIQQEFSKILLLKDISQNEKDKQYAHFMTTLERTYRIPMMRSENYDRNNPDVMRVYRMISDSRKTLH